MNYLILKSIVETTLKNFRCKECQSSVLPQDIQIVGIQGSKLSMKIHCGKCNADAGVQAEVHVGGLPQQNITQTPSASIKDEDIISIRSALKNSGSVSDLFSEWNK